jgi:quinol monooxygenase YgiN
MPRLPRNLLLLSVLSLGVALGCSSPSVAQRERGRNAMYAITITMRALPGRENELIETSREVILPSRAEPGCLFFDLLTSVEDPREIVFYEAYRRKEDFDIHLATPHAKAWVAAALPIVDRATIRMPSHTSVGDGKTRTE